MEDITPNKINNVGQFPERIAGPNAGFKLRALGFVYLAIGGIFLWIVIKAPVILKAAVPYNYHVPHACECLECLHGYREGPDGNLYCAKYLPKEILDQNISPFIKKARLIAGAVFGILGLLFAILMTVAGFLWLLGLWIPTKPARWYTVICRLAPLIIVLFWLISFSLKAIYPIPPR